MAEMKAIKLRPFIPSGENYGLAQRFFQDLGFEILYSDDRVSLFRVGEAEFFLQNFHDQAFQNQYMVELVVEHLDDWWERLQKENLGETYGVRMKAPTIYPWGKREIHLIDPAGVCWHISEATK